MGVDFMTCKICDYNFPDCGDYSRCGKCDSLFCSDCGSNYVILGECAEEEGDTRKSTCPFCTMKIIPAKDLLKFALTLLDKSKSSLEQDYRAHKALSKKKKSDER